MVIRQYKDKGLYAGIFGSNISNTNVPNGSSEIDLFIGYIYKCDNELAFRFELKSSHYPGGYASLPTKDSYDKLEIAPGVIYKMLSVYVAYSLRNMNGVNQNTALTYPVYLKPNRSSRGTYYIEANLNIPIPDTKDKLKLRLTYGYLFMKNYNDLNYANFGTGLSYVLPKKWFRLIVSINGSATMANKKYYKITNGAGKSKDSVATKVWLGVTKEF